MVLCSEEGGGGGGVTRCYLQVTRKELSETFALEHTQTHARAHQLQTQGEHRWGGVSVACV